MEVDRHRERRENEKGLREEREREREERGDHEREEPKGCRRRAKENAAALPANSRRPAIFTRPIK